MFQLSGAIYFFIFLKYNLSHIENWESCGLLRRVDRISGKMAAIQNRVGETIYSFPWRTIILPNCCQKRKHKLSHVWISPSFTFSVEITNIFAVWLNFWERKKLLKSYRNKSIFKPSQLPYYLFLVSILWGEYINKLVKRDWGHLHLYLGLFRHKKTSAFFQWEGFIVYKITLSKKENKLASLWRCSVFRVCGPGISLLIQQTFLPHFLWPI